MEVSGRLHKLLKSKNARHNRHRDRHLFKACVSEVFQRGAMFFHLSAYGHVEANICQTMVKVAIQPAAKVSVRAKGRLVVYPTA